MKLLMLALGASLALLGVSLLKISTNIGVIIAMGGGLVFFIYLQQLFKSFTQKMRGPAIAGDASEAALVSPARTTSAASPLVIHNPRLGLLNLVGEAALSFYLQDLDNLEDVFIQNVDTGTQQVPKCDVLFLYCQLEANGQVSGQKFTLREVVKSAGARVVVVASENRSEILTRPMFSQYLQSTNDWPVNFIFTINRNGETFGFFFQKFFSQMFAGVSLQQAWTQLAPQNPSSQKECPAIMAMLEAGHVTLRPI
jgi:hypothetical protein